MRALPPPQFVAIHGGGGGVGALPADLAAAASAEVAAALAGARAGDAAAGGSGGGGSSASANLAVRATQPASAVPVVLAQRPRFRLLDLHLPTEEAVGGGSGGGGGDTGFPDGVSVKPLSAPPSAAPLNPAASAGGVAAATRALSPPRPQLASWAAMDRERRLKDLLGLLEAPV